MTIETPPPPRHPPRTWRDLLGVVLHGQYEPVGLLLSMVAGTWAFILLSPGDTLASLPAYGWLHALGQDTLWGILALVLAVLPFVAWRGRRLLLGRLVMTGHVGFWAIVTVSFFQQAPLNTGWGVYGVLACFSLWTTLRIAGTQRRRG